MTYLVTLFLTYLAFYLTLFLTYQKDILFHISSDILSDILFGILSDIRSCGGGPAERFFLSNLPSVSPFRSSLMFMEGMLLAWFVFLLLVCVCVCVLFVGWLSFVFSTHFFYRQDCMSTILILQQILTLDLTATALPLARPTVKTKNMVFRSL